jgi:hypothetical protein
MGWNGILPGLSAALPPAMLPGLPAAPPPAIPPGLSAALPPALPPGLSAALPPAPGLSAAPPPVSSTRRPQARSPEVCMKVSTIRGETLTGMRCEGRVGTIRCDNCAGFKLGLGDSTIRRHTFVAMKFEIKVSTISWRTRLVRPHLSGFGMDHASYEGVGNG